MKPLELRQFPHDTLEVARWLLGCQLVRVTPFGVRFGRIVETEGYTEDDPASHSYAGPRVRNLPMFGPPGTAYVYRSYGVHCCMNVVTGPRGCGEAVLIRALEPVAGLDEMRVARGMSQEGDVRALCSGPGKLCQALGIGLEWNGRDLFSPQGLYLAPPDPAPASGTEIISTTRIGISKGADLPRRFLISGNRFVSRPPK